MKKRKITNSMQEVAVDIFQEFEALLMNTHERQVDCNYIVAILGQMSKKYGLCEDPFTKMLCTSKQYEKLEEEYRRQCFDLYYDIKLV